MTRRFILCSTGGYYAHSTNVEGEGFSGSHYGSHYPNSDADNYLSLEFLFFLKNHYRIWLLILKLL